MWHTWGLRRSIAMSQDLKDLQGIPDASKELWTRLVVEERRPVHALIKEVKNYQQAIAQRSTVRNADVDPTLGFALADASMKLLTTIKDDTPDERRAAIQAAVRYFVIEDDADSDLDSILGLDDDAEVVNAVLKHLGHDDWLVEVL
jgi:uncharacterized membrane protein YkvA (DUF1232 family)